MRRARKKKDIDRSKAPPTIVSTLRIIAKLGRRKNIDDPTTPIEINMQGLVTEEGLDGINHNVNIQGSVGKARHRLVGLILHIRIEATSQDNENWGLPGGRVFSRWYLESEPVWQRIINPDIYLPSGAIQSTSLYGVRFHFTKLPSLVMVPSAEQTLRSLLDLGIVLIGLKMLAYVVALNCYGDDSRRWKKTVYNECEVLSSMHEEQALKMSFIDFKKRMSKLNVGADEVEMLESATEYVGEKE
jgi:hypothetical protein